MSNHRFETICANPSLETDPAYGAVMPPVYLTSTYRQSGVGDHLGYEYSRTGNPTRSALEQTLALLEGGAQAFAFASGMAAIDAVIHLLEPGDHILAVNDLYGGTYRLLQDVYSHLGIRSDFADAADHQGFLEQIRPNTRLVWLESPTNPRLTLCDIARIAAGAKSVSPEIIVAVDNTFATPYLQRPLELGADIAMHSTTKYLGGHSDVVGGAVVLNDRGLAERLGFLQNSIGAIPGPLDCFLVLRGIRTLALRMDRHAQNATLVAEYLSAQAHVAQLFYPGHRSHPQAELAKRQMRNGGGMLSFRVRGGRQAAQRFATSTRLFALAESLGGVESLVEVPAAMTHLSAADSPVEVSPDLIRVSVGIEAADDLIEDLEQAFAALG